MPITPKQIKNLARLDTDTLIEILHICANCLGAVSVEEYCQVLGKKKRAVYYAISEKRVKFVEIGGVKFPLINYKK